MSDDKNAKLQDLESSGKVDFKNLADPSPAVFEGKAILITGGASGLGKACARMFAAAGAYVLIADRDEHQGKELEAELGTRSKFVQVDVLSYHSQLLLFAAALQFFPNRRLDTLITFAGVGSKDWSLTPYSDGAERLFEYARASESSTESDLIVPPSTQAVDVALHGSLFSVHIAVKYAFGLDPANSSKPPEAPNLSRSIILVSSIAGYRHLENRPDYTAAKYGARGIMRSLRASLPQITESAGVRLNLLAPFFIPTPMTAATVPVLEKMGVQIARIDDVAKAAAILTANTGINGRAVSITAEGLRDLCDDLAGHEGGREVNALSREGWLSGNAKPTR